MLKVVGDSMIGAAIADGDWVVVRREADIENGDIVAAMIENDMSADSEATVKTFKKSDRHVWLIPHNPTTPPSRATRPRSSVRWSPCCGGSDDPALTGPQVPKPDRSAAVHV